MSKFFKFVIIVLIGVSLAGPAYAQLVPCGEEGNECRLCHFWQLASRIINFITFNLALAIAPLLFVVAGVLFLTSEGNEQRVTKARSIFLNTVIGLVIVFCSWLMVDTIIKTASGGSFNNIVPAWNQFPPCSTYAPGQAY